MRGARLPEISRRLQAEWSARTRREQLLLVILALVVTIFCIFRFVWHPLAEARARSEERIGQLEDLARRVEAAPIAAADAPPTQDPRSVTALVSDGAPGFGLSILRLQPRGDGAEVTLADADFSSVIGWIADLEFAHRLRIVDLDLTRRTDPGIVGATLFVTR